jgi:microcystin-dependent protein
MPQHIHFLQGTSNTTNNTPTVANNLPAKLGSSVYSEPTGLQTLRPNSVTNVGGSQAHTNLMPYLVLNFCIALIGIFPSQN